MTQDAEVLTFAELLDHLGHTAGDHIALCHKKADGLFTTIINTPAILPIVADSLTDADVWFSINTLTGPPRTGPRGDANTVTRLTCLWADIDIKAGACPDLATAELLVGDISVAIGTRPSAVIHSGHGLQPLWVIDDPDNTTLDNPDQRGAAATLVRRWGRLVATIADRRGIAVDNVFDLARILRVPGTINHKDTPVPTTAVADTGAPLTVGEICDRLDEYGVPELEFDPLLDEPVDTATWQWAEETCTYTQKMIDGWKTATPDARHPWMMSQLTRLAAAHRKGCITADDHRRGIDIITARMEHLCGGSAGSNARHLSVVEVREGAHWGRHRAALKTDDGIDKELGNHSHGMRFEVIEGGFDGVASLASASQAANIGGALLAPAGKPIEASYTDVGNAQRLIHAHGHRLRYNPSRKLWMEWTGTHWSSSDDAAPAMAAAHDVAMNLPDTTKEQISHRKYSLSHSGNANMVALARYDERIRVTPHQLDAHPMLLNTPSGTVDLTDGTQHEHRPAEHHTKITGVGYDADMPTPRWQQFLGDTFAGDDELVAYLQRVLGYATTGRVSHHILPFLHGSGANGKSVLTDVVLSVLGDYAITLPSSVLISQRYAHDTELARLAGARVAICSEVAEDGRFDEGRVKSLTGGDRLSARFLYSNPFEFDPTHTLVLSGNHQPSVHMGGDSFWRRLRLIPFAHTVPEEKRIDNLAATLVREEGPGILAWLVQGAIAAAGGMNEPASVQEATKRYEREEDSFGQFVTDCLHQAPGSDLVKVEGTKLRQSYSQWCKANGITEVSAQAFGREMKRRTGASIKASNGKRWYYGIALIESDKEEDGRWGRD